MPQRVEECVESTKKSLRKRYPKESDKKITSRAWAICQDLENKGKLSDSMSDNVFYCKSSIKTYSSMTEAMAFLGEDVFLTEDAKLLLESERRVGPPSDGGMSIGTTYSSSLYHTITESGTDIAHATTASEPKPVSHILVAGIAISAGVTRNLNNYLAEELAKAAPSLAGKPIQLDHSHKAMDNIGKVIASSYDGSLPAVKYLGRIREGLKVTDAVRTGDLDGVSIGAYAEDITCNICGKTKVLNSEGGRCKHRLGMSYEGDKATAVGRDISFVELSVTPVPADPRASAGIVTHDSAESAIYALAESYQPRVGSMSEDTDVKLSAELQEKDTQLAELQDRLAKAESREKQRLAEGIVEHESSLGVLKPSDKGARLSGLKEKSTETLEELESSLSRQIAVLARRPDVPASRGRITEAPARSANELDWAEGKAFVREIFGLDPPTKEAVRTTARMIRDPEFELHRAYKNLRESSGGNR